MKTLILIALLSFQPPKWNYIVHREIRTENASMPRYDAKGKITNRYQYKWVKTPFTNSRAAHRFFMDGIGKRDSLVYINGSAIIHTRIDSIPRK